MIEVAALGRVYRENRNDETPLMIGTIKTNIGHLEAASGTAGLIKVLLTLQNQNIPANLHFKTLNPRIDLSSIPARIPTTLQLWKGTSINPG